MTVQTHIRDVPEGKRHFRRGSLTIAAPAGAKPARRVEDGAEREPDDVMIAADAGTAGYVVESWNEQERTVEAVLSAGADVERYEYDERWNVVRYVERLRMDAASIRMVRLSSGAMPWLVMHRTGDVDSLVGVVLRGWLDENNRLRVLIRLSDDEESAPTVRKIINGTLRGVSVGYWIYREEITTEPGQLEIREAIDWEPFEGSSVIVPADPAGAIRSHQPPAPKPIQEPTMSAPATSTAPDQAAIRAAVEAENKRVTTIQSRAAALGLGDDVIKPLVDDTTITVEAAAVRMLDAVASQQEKQRLTPTPGLQFVSDAGDARRLALEDVIELKLGMRHDLSDRARSLGLLNLRMDTIAHEVLRGSGMEPKGFTVPAEVFKRSVKHHMARSMGGIQTSATLPSLLENVANKALLKPFVGEAAIYEQISFREDLPDFRNQSVVTMNAYPDLVEIPEGDDITYGVLGDGADTWRLYTYGKGVQLTFQAMINDDLRGIARVLQTAPNAVYARRAALFWAMLTANSGAGQSIKGANLISSGHLNVGTPGALAAGTVNELVLLLMKQLMPGSSEQFMQQTPTHILLPIHYREIWKQISQQYYMPTSAATAKTDLLMGLEVIAVPQLGTSGNKPFYVLAKENTPFVHGTLQGQPGPMMEQETDFDSGGIKMKVVDHFGCKAVDYHGIAGNLYS